MVSVAPKHQSPPAGAGPRVGRAPPGAVSAMAGGIRAASEPARQSRRVLSGGPAARPELRVANASSPLLRGLGVDSRGNVYVTATSCHRVLKITPDGQVTSILKSERPWSPTGVAVNGEEIYVLEYTNANGPATEGWHPRVRRLARDNTVTTLVTVPIEASSASSR